MECLMQDLVKRASELAARLKAGNHTVAVAESSTGGMLSAALLAVPGASAYFIGGAVVYTRASRRVLLGISDEAMAGMRPSTEAYALLVARTAQQRFATTWGSARPARRGRQATAMAMPPATAASPSSARSSARSRSKPAAPTASATWRLSPRRRSTC
jgi:PncC family amidohydrolase